MGKSKAKKRFSGPRPNPNGMTSLKNEVEEQAEDVWQRIASQLQSGSSEERECGCASLSILGRTVEAAEAVMEHRLVRIVAPLLTDGDVSVRHAAIGALKNVSLASPDICDQMVQQDVMTPLFEILTKLGTSQWRPVEKARKIDSSQEIFVECVELLWNLVEANEIALRTFVNKSQVIDILMGHVNVEVYGARVVVAVLQCLYTTSEDADDKLLAKLCENEEPLASVRMRPDSTPLDLYMRLLATGIAINIRQSKGEDLEPILPEVIDTLVRVLVQDQRKLVHEYSSAIPLTENGVPVDDEDKMESEVTDSRLELIRNDLNSVILGQQAALELLTNLCCDDLTDEWLVEAEDEMASDDGDDTAMEEGEPSGLPAVLIEAIASNGLVKQVLAKANLPAENVKEILKSSAGKKYDGSIVLQMASTLRSRAFLCLNSLVEALTVEDFGGDEAMFDLWSNLGRVIFETEADEVTVEAASSAMRATSQKLSDAKSPRFKSVGIEDLAKLFEVGTKTSNANIRINVIHIGANVGPLTTDEVTKAVTAFLIESATSDADLRVVAEALDKIFDLFAEDETDDLCRDINLVNKLKDLLPGLKVKVGMQKNKRSEDTSALISIAMKNLNRFIKYKEKRFKSHTIGRN